MGHPSADNPDALFKVHDAELDASVARAELRNAKALADKLQTLLDSKTHAYEAMHNEAQQLSNRLEALHAEMESIRHENDFNADMAKRWQADCESARKAIAQTMEVLMPHVDISALFERGRDDPSGKDVFAVVATAQNVVARLGEPDMDTVPLADLLEAVGTYLEHDQAVTIRGSFDPVRHVHIHAMGLTFAVETHEASESLTKLQELGGCLVVEAAR